MQYRRLRRIGFQVSEIGFGDRIASLAEAALRFCLSNPAVSTVIVGMRTAEHAEANCRVSDARYLSPEDLTALRSHAWPHNYYA